MKSIKTLSNNLNKLYVSLIASPHSFSSGSEHKQLIIQLISVQMKVNREMKKAIVGSPLIFTRDVLTISAFTDKYEVIKQFP